MRMKLFEYAVLIHPGEVKDGEKQADKTLLIKGPATVLAKDEKQAGTLVAREIPEDCIDKLDRVEVIIRPF